MSSKMLFMLLFLCYSDNSFGKVCEDCVFIRICPEAAKLAKQKDPITKEIFFNALCGFEFVNGKKKSKVCCSDFNINTRFRGNKSTIVPPTSTTSTDNDESDFDIEAHPNFHLLPKECGPIKGDRIFDGEFADLYEFPWMTLLSFNMGTWRGRKKYKFRCGGSVINSKYILTAAHCISKNLEGIRVGDYDIRRKVDCQGEPPNVECEDNLEDRIIEAKIPHPNYTANPVANDIALIRLQEPLDFSFRNARPICLPTSKTLRNKNLSGKVGTVAGWGITETGKESRILKKVHLPILPEADCEDFYNKNPDLTRNNRLDKKFCAGEELKDTCKGDSGGPMMLEDEYNDGYRILQFGIVSFGPKQCGSSTPGVYTDVTKYLKWILDNIKE